MNYSKHTYSSVFVWVAGRKKVYIFRFFLLSSLRDKLSLMREWHENSIVCATPAIRILSFSWFYPFPTSMYYNYALAAFFFFFLHRYHTTTTTIKTKKYSLHDHSRSRPPVLERCTTIPLPCLLLQYINVHKCIVFLSPFPAGMFYLLSLFLFICTRFLKRIKKTNNLKTKCE